jgi:hypothetical protein
MSWSTVLLKPHLYHDPSVDQPWYNIIPQHFQIRNTIDSAVKGMPANDMTGSTPTHIITPGFPSHPCNEDSFWPRKHFGVGSCGKLLASLKRELSRETKLSKIVYKRMPK